MLEYKLKEQSNAKAILNSQTPYMFLERSNMHHNVPKNIVSIFIYEVDSLYRFIQIYKKWIKL